MTTPAPYSSSQPPARLDGTTERSVSMLAHLSGLIATIVSAGWLTFVGPLAVWFVYKDRSPGVRQASAGAFNFNLAVWVAFIVAWVLAFTVILLPVSILIWVVFGVVDVWCSIKGAVRAGQGQPYSYPFGIRVLS